MSWRGRIRFVGGVGEGRMEGRRGGSLLALSGSGEEMGR